MGGFRTRKGNKIIRLSKKAKYLILISATLSYNSPVDWYWPLKLCNVIDVTRDEFRIKFMGAFQMIGKRYLMDTFPTNMKLLMKLIDKVEVYTGTDRNLTINKKLIKSKAKFNSAPKFEESSAVRKEVADIKYKFFKKYHEKGKLSKRAVIFTHHIDLTKGIAELLGCKFISGEVKASDRQQILKDFNLQKTNYVVVSILCGGAGINIHNCDTCYFVELGFSPKVHEQAYLRLVRSEEDTEINVNYFILEEDTQSEEHAKRVVDKKDNYFNQLENY